jgi:hypothetical protein
MRTDQERSVALEQVVVWAEAADMDGKPARQLDLGGGDNKL